MSKSKTNLEPAADPIGAAPEQAAPAPVESTETTAQIPAETAEQADAVSIAKPSAFSLDKFKAKRAPTIAGVEPLPESLTVMKIADANDFLRLHHDEENYWSDTLCFVNVPVKGTKKENLHLITEDIATGHLPSKKIQRFRLALASKPHDIFFLCKIPVTNLDNKFNETALIGCEQAKTTWVQVVSRKDQGHDDYQIIPAKNQKAFPEPKWPTQSLDKLIEIAFKGRMIETDDHPGLLRLIGDKQQLG
jgi:hypothetical protein